MRELAELYMVFLKIGAVTFGGGLAMLPLLQKEIIEDRNWMTQEELSEYYAVGICMPGVLALNVSTFVGAKRKGLLGGILASLGFVTVPLVCIAVLSGTLQKCSSVPKLMKAMSCIRAFICIIVIDAIVKFWKKNVIDRFSVVMVLGIILLKFICISFGVSLNSVSIVIMAAAMGVLKERGKLKRDLS